MKIKATLIALAVAALLPMAASAQTYVSGYTKKDGTYVAPHYRSSPNNTKLDNYSTRGNVNPYTGQVGTRDPYTQPQVQYRPYTPPPTRYTPQPTHSQQTQSSYGQPQKPVQSTASSYGDGWH